MAEELDKKEPGWKISGKYVSLLLKLCLVRLFTVFASLQAVVLLSEGRPGEKVRFA